MYTAFGIGIHLSIRDGLGNHNRDNRQHSHQQAQAQEQAEKAPGQGSFFHNIPLSNSLQMAPQEILHYWYGFLLPNNTAFSLYIQDFFAAHWENFYRFFYDLYIWTSQTSPPQDAFAKESSDGMTRSRPNDDVSS
jgi:hypothetical protein